MVHLSRKSHSISSPYLFQSRHGVWYARVVVPEDKRDVIGKGEFRKSLATKDRFEAVRRSWEVLQLLRKIVDENYSGGLAPSITPSIDSKSPRNVESAPKVTLTTQPEVPPKAPALSSVVASFCNEKLVQQAWSPHTEQQNRSTFAELMKVIGDVEITKFNRSLSLKYKQYILKNNSKLSVVTLNKKLTRVSALMQWAAPHYDVPNPMIGLSIKIAAKVKASNQREALTDIQIKQLLQAVPDVTEVHRPFKAWIPRLALYTGARIGELSQLYLDDFMVIDGHPCILIRATHPDQTIKTPASERAVPIHPKLITMGFLQFVERQLSLGHQRLFPELTKHFDRGYSHQVSKWFSTFKGKMGWTNVETLHGIRHSVATQLKRKEFNSDMVAGLLGHSHGSITFDRYGKEYKVDNLFKVVTALDWE